MLNPVVALSHSLIHIIDEHKQLEVLTSFSRPGKIYELYHGLRIVMGFTLVKGGGGVVHRMYPGHWRIQLFGNLLSFEPFLETKLLIILLLLPS